jgi:hypothetical protein
MREMTDFIADGGMDYLFLPICSLLYTTSPGSYGDRMNIGPTPQEGIRTADGNSLSFDHG